MRITKIEHSNTKRSNAVGKMALVDLLDTRSNHQFVKKNIVSANCNKAKYNKTKYVCTQKRKGQDCIFLTEHLLSICQS